MKSTYPRKDIDSIRSMVSTWQSTGRRILENVHALVVSRKYKYTAEHKRSILPSVTKLGLWLLPYPCFPISTEVDDQFKLFAKDLKELLRTTLEGDKYVLRWSRVAEDAFTISEIFNTDEERLRAALYIGRPLPSLDRASDQLSLALNLIQVALAMKLIENGWYSLKTAGKNPLSEIEKDLMQRLKQMVVEWQSDFDDGVWEKVANWRRDKKDLWAELMST
jgi:hypothetical protein